jgi:putative aldouronate transport system permease protein
MATTGLAQERLQRSRERLQRFWEKPLKYLPLYLMLLPGIIYYLVFRYGPIYGVVIAFKDFRVLDGIMASPWVGFKHFEALFSSPYFGRIMKNTLTISLLKLIVGFPPPIILALMLNEVRIKRLKKLIQTVSYLPHFLSWIVISGILFAFLAPGSGLINHWIKNAGGQVIPFMMDKTWFLLVIVLSSVWKEVGWGAIVYLAALSGISPDLYEAATMDGASRVQQMWYISIPGMQPVIILMLILRLGYLLNAGFEQIYILYNPLVYEVADIIDTWVFRNGIEQFRFSLATATGVFKSVIGMALLLTSNKLAKQWSDQGIW